MVHGLAEVAVVGPAFLLAMRGIGSAIQVEDDARRHPVPLAFAQIQFPPRHRQAIAVARRHPVLQPREGWLAGEILSRRRQPPANQLQQRVVAQGVRIVLVRVAGDDLVDALPPQIA